MSEAPQAPESVEENFWRYLMTFRRFFNKLSALIVNLQPAMHSGVCFRRQIRQSTGVHTASTIIRPLPVCRAAAFDVARRSCFGMVHLQHRASSESSLCL